MKSSFIFLLLVLCILASCNKKSDSSTHTYFGGLIVNPTSDFVVLLRKDVVIDTFYLDDQNSFGGKLMNAEKGLYVFKHPPENQIMYIEPGDSTLIRVNTIEFDESLTFSGNGAAESNYLNQMYLLNQNNNDLILSYYRLNPSEFAEKTDSILKVRNKQFEDLKSRNNFSKEFSDMAKATINYEYYDLRERYAFLIRKYSKEYINSIPEDFHKYRENISFNDENLEDYYVYLNLIDDYLRTRSLECCEKSTETDPSCMDLTSYENIERRMYLVDTLITNQRIKNSFVERLVAQGIIYSKSRKEIIAMLDLLKVVNYDGDRINDLKMMGGIQNSVLPGKNLGDLKLLSVHKDTIKINSISQKPKISFHWSVNSQHHHKWQHKIIKDLREKYPEIDFIGINIDKDQIPEWKNAIKNNSYSAQYEYKLNLGNNINDVLLKNYLNKLIFMDRNGIIVSGDTQLSTLDYESNILEFVNSQ